MSNVYQVRLWQSIVLENLNGNRTVPLAGKLSKVIFVDQQVWFWVAGVVARTRVQWIRKRG